MSSGVAVRQEVVDSFLAIKLKHQYSYVVYKLTDDLKEICVEKCAEIGATYDDFLVDMNQAKANGECRYAVFDAKYSHEGHDRNKLVFIMWAPEDAKLKQKMIYTSSKDAIRKKCDGIAKEIQATDHDELSWDHVLEVCKSTSH